MVARPHTAPTAVAVAAAGGGKAIGGKASGSQRSGEAMGGKASGGKASCTIFQAYKMGLRHYHVSPPPS